MKYDTYFHFFNYILYIPTSYFFNEFQFLNNNMAFLDLQFLFKILYLTPVSFAITAAVAPSASLLEEPTDTVAPHLVAAKLSNGNLKIFFF